MPLGNLHIKRIVATGIEYIRRSMIRGLARLGETSGAFAVGCIKSACETRAVGQRTAAILAQHGQAPEKLVLINLGKTFLPEGTVPQLEHQAGIDAAGIARAVQEART